METGASQYDDQNERRRLRTVLLTCAVSVVSLLVLYDKPWSGGTAAVVLTAVNCGLFGWHILAYRDRVMARLLLFGLALGLVELVADALCVRFTHTLNYSVARSPLLWLSPWWMPLAWMLVGSQIGYLGARLSERIGWVRGSALTAILGAINIPFYEEMAYHVHFWQYTRCHMAFGSHTPFYIITAELVIGAALAPCARIALRGTWRTALIAGAGAGIATIVGGLIGYGLWEFPYRGLR